MLCVPSGQNVFVYLLLCENYFNFFNSFSQNEMLYIQPLDSSYNNMILPYINIKLILHLWGVGQTICSQGKQPPAARQIRRYELLTNKLMHPRRMMNVSLASWFSWERRTQPSLLPSWDSRYTAPCACALSGFVLVSYDRTALRQVGSSSLPQAHKGGQQHHRQQSVVVSRTAKNLRHALLCCFRWPVQDSSRIRDDRERRRERGREGESSSWMAAVLSLHLQQVAKQCTGVWLLRTSTSSMSSRWPDHTRRDHV